MRRGIVVLIGGIVAAALLVFSTLTEASDGCPTRLALMEPGAAPVTVMECP